MPEIPDSRLGKIEYFEVHAPIWNAQAIPLGLDAIETLALVNETGDARTAYDAAVAARDASKAATLDFYQKVNDMHDHGSGLLAQIRGKVDSSGNPNLYVLAQVEPPADPTPAPPPDPATDMAGFINNVGDIDLSWKGSVSNGTFFTVWRKLPTDDDFIQVASLGTLQWTDSSVAAGTTFVQYIVYANRDSFISAPTEPISILFGQQQAAA